MNAAQLADALKNAHVEHARLRLQEKRYWQQQLDDGVKALGKTPVGALVDPDALAKVVDDWLASVNTAQGLRPVIIEVSEAILEQAGDDPATVGELLNEAHFEAILEQALRLKTLREKAIHACLNHPLVSDMVSEMLYTGIKNFLLEENVLAKLPGVSSMMKLGRKSVGKAMGGLEDSIRDYLRHNTRATLKTGEQWLNRQLTDQHIAELARDGYRRLAPLKPADVIKTAPKGLAPALATGAAVLDQQGVLTPWIEQTLGDFYDSDACKDVLEKALS